MADPPQKRARTSSSSKSVEPPIDPERAARLPGLLERLDQSTLQKILLQAAKEYPGVAKSIEEYWPSVIQAEKNTIIDFDNHSKSVWKTIKVQYSHLSSSEQYDASGDALHSVMGTIKDIKEKCPTYASLETKMDALEALRKIGRVIARSWGDAIAKEIHESFHGKTDLEKIMLGIVQSMTPEQRQATSNESDDDNVSWIDKLVEFKELADEEYMFEDLTEVIDTLAPGYLQEYYEDDNELKDE